MRRDHLARRAASAALAACMMFTLSAPALAESTDALMQLSMASRSAVSVLDAENSVQRTFNIENGSIRVYAEESALWVQQGTDHYQYNVDSSVAISGTSNEYTLTIEGHEAGANVVLRNLNIDVSDKSDTAAVSVSGKVELTLEGTNVLKSGSYCAGLQKNDDGQLTINGTGSLEAYGKDGGAGIGSCRGNAVSNITIKGGMITAVGSDNAAGIGSGQGGNAASNLIIEDGIVTARGGDNAAGIGGGYFGGASNITIRGGTVKAYAGYGAPAIGSGMQRTAENISITGGEITVQKNGECWIGGYYNGEIPIDPTELHKNHGSITYLNEDGEVDHKTFVTKIKVNEATVTSYNYTDILRDGRLSYDPDTKTLKSSGKISKELTINAPNVPVVLDGNGDVAVENGLTITDSASVEITGGVAGKAAAIKGNANITSSGTVTITGKGDRAMGGDKLTVNAVGDVTITGDVEAAAIWKDADITSTGGSVTINNKNSDGWAQGTKEVGGTLIVKAENGSVNIIGSSGGGELLMQNATITSGIPLTLENKSNAALAEELHVTINSADPWVYYTSNSPDAEVGDPRIAPIPAEAGNGSYLHAEASELHDITVTNGTFQVGNDETGLTTAFPGEEVTVTGHDENASFSKFVKWEVVKAPDGFTLSDEQQNTETMTFTMPGEPVELKAIYSIPSITMDVPVIVTDGTINDSGESYQLVKPGTAITVKANEKDEPVQFHHWKVEQGTSEDFALTEGSSLGSETEAGTEEIHFIMPKGGVRLTAVYSVPAGVQKNYVTVDGGIGTATINGSNNAKAEVEIGSDVTVSAEVDQSQYPGMVFDYWEIVYPDSFEKLPEKVRKELELTLDDAASSTATFTMPKYPVTLVAHWKDGVEPGFDDPTDPDFGKDGSGAAGAIVAGAALGGAAIWGGYEITTRAILNDLLPEGAAIPANRGQLAALIWAEKGKPEPAAQPAFTDVADAGLAKAAQWCVEQGLLDAKDGKFDPDGWMPKYKTIEVWKKAFPKQ